MKKCYYFPTWEEQEDVLISLGEKRIYPKSSTPDGIKMIYSPIALGEFLINYKVLESTPFDPILAKLCELTGAKMYGDYIVYSNPENCIVKYYTKQDKSEYIISDYKHNLTWSSIKFYGFELHIDPFHEYSKFLRKEENKWEEIKKVLCI